jgi:N-dimethylarginine dimethylaminohydrolase
MSGLLSQFGIAGTADTFTWIDIKMQNQTMSPLVNSFDSWSRLREVILGDVYPVEWYEHLPGEIRDVFQLITQWTKEDLNQIEKKLVDDFGIVVQRPKYTNIDHHIDNRDVLRKPQICPRDLFVTLGNEFWLPEHLKHLSSFHHLYQRYQPYLRQHNFEIMFNGANVVKVGKDVFVDCVHSLSNQNIVDQKQYFEETVASHFPDFRLHYVNNGGHLDGCFAVLKPGHLLVNRYYSDYDSTFPGWNRLTLNSPEFFDHVKHQKNNWRQFGTNGRWWLPGDPPVPGSFHEHVIKYAQDWVGNYTETFFEVNCLVIDEKNVMMLGENQAVFRYLETLGITAHPMEFRCRTFWDGGLHCLTMDIQRDGKMATYL